MNRLDCLVDECNQARGDVLALAKEPIKSGDLIEGLSHSIVDRWATLAIGDGRGEWDGCPHQLALSDLIDEGELVWWRDENLDVWYGPSGSVPADQTGDDTPAVRRIENFLDEVANALGIPRCDVDGNYNPAADGAETVWGHPCLGVREIDHGGNSVSIHVDGKSIEVVDYDFVCGAGDGELFWSSPWPDVTVDEAVRQVKMALGVGSSMP